jgi:DNA-binding MarR family transcriptional regulator
MTSEGDRLMKRSTAATGYGAAESLGSGDLSPEEEHEFWGLLNQVRDTMIRLRDREVRYLGVTSMQGGVLWVLRELEKESVPATPAEISRRLFRQPPTTLALLDRLVKLGLITTENVEGRRQVLVALTDKGRDTYRAYATKREVIPRVLGSLPPEERLQLRSSLVKLRQKAREELVSFPP